MDTLSRITAVERDVAALAARHEELADAVQGDGGFHERLRAVEATVGVRLAQIDGKLDALIADSTERKGALAKLDGRVGALELSRAQVVAIVLAVGALSGMVGPLIVSRIDKALDAPVQPRTMGGDPYSPSVWPVR